MIKLFDEREKYAVRVKQIVGEVFKDGEVYADEDSLRAWRKMDEEARALRIRSAREWHG